MLVLESRASLYVLYARNSVEMLKLLLEYGANVKYVGRDVWKRIFILMFPTTCFMIFLRRVKM